MRLGDGNGRMPSSDGTGGDLSPLVARRARPPLLELAASLRAEAEQIALAWDAPVARAFPQVQHLRSDASKDLSPANLTAIADALASRGPGQVREPVCRAPGQGPSRSRPKFDARRHAGGPAS